MTLYSKAIAANSIKVWQMKADLHATVPFTLWGEKMVSGGATSACACMARGSLSTSPHLNTAHIGKKRYPGVLDDCRTNADEDGTRTRATFVTRKLIAKQC
jgi:hypothetical protein